MGRWMWEHREAVLVLGCCKERGKVSSEWECVVWIVSVSSGRARGLRNLDIQWTLSAVDPFNVWNAYVPNYSFSTLSTFSVWFPHLFKLVASWFLSLCGLPSFSGLLQIWPTLKAKVNRCPHLCPACEVSSLRWIRESWRGWDVLYMLCASVSGMAFVLLPSTVDLAGFWDPYKWQSVGMEE